jgi:hypothetical protein
VKHPAIEQRKAINFISSFPLSISALSNDKVKAGTPVAVTSIA